MEVKTGYGKVADIAMILAYIIFWDNEEIGNIYTDGNNQYKYIPDNAKLKKFDAAPMSILGIPQLEWGRMPKFFAERIAHDSECKNNCRYATDRITIKKIKS